MVLFRQMLFFLATAIVAVFCLGCLSEQPSGPLNNGGATTVANKPTEPELPPGNPEDVAALKAAGAYCPANQGARITTVELSSSATDEQLKHLAGLPGVQRLQCNSRGITDAGI